MPKDAFIIGIGKPKSSMEHMGDSMEEEDSEGDVKAEAGNELASAIKSGDGRAICEAVKAIMALEDDYDAEE